jgi:dihydrolipoamide dehydrogenase
MSEQFDVGIIGAGPGGYVAAIRSAQLGLKTVIIEAQKALGGTCLNWGCIPSKALLDSSEHYHQAIHKFGVHGIKTGKVSVDWSQMQKRKNDVVENTTQGIDYLMSKNKITVEKGLGTFKSPTEVQVKNGKKNTIVTANKWVIATGSSVTELPCAPMDGQRIIGSNEGISLPEIPKEMIVIGGGVIGVELGSVYARLGTKVTIIEFFDRLLPTMDKDLGKGLQKALKSLNMVFHFNTKVTKAEVKKNVVHVTAEDKAGKEIKLTADYTLVSIGRRPNTDGLGLDNIGVALDSQGRVEINQNFETNISGIYAIGDVVKGAMLAHKASEEGVVCIEKIAGHQAHLNYNTIPGVVYTWPEVASVGKTEQELKDAGVAYNAGKFPFKASGRARASEESDGFIKVISDKTTDEILGVHMIGPRAADMIAEAVVAMEYRASAEDIAMLVHPHPTFTEAIKEAALGATGNRAIHI